MTALLANRFGSVVDDLSLVEERAQIDCLDRPLPAVREMQIACASLHWLALDEVHAGLGTAEHDYMRSPTPGGGSTVRHPPDPESPSNGP